MSLNILIVEDDYTSQVVMEGMLKIFGNCNIAVNGREAVKAFQAKMAQGERYDLICLDIMMPGMDGQEVLKKIRQIEMENGILGLDGVKIIMTTALADSDNILAAFREQCEAYIIKPIDKEKLLSQLKKLGLIHSG